MAQDTLTLSLPNLPATHGLAQRIAPLLQPGMTLLFHGPIGAGKSALCRAIIHALQDVPEDVPSPTFTLVQIYDTRAGELWHADLYRLTGSDDAIELGLMNAMQDAICLIEWPDRLGDLAPETALNLTLTPLDDPDARSLVITGPAPLLQALSQEATT